MGAVSNSVYMFVSGIEGIQPYTYITKRNIDLDKLWERTYAHEFEIFSPAISQEETLFYMESPNQFDTDIISLDANNGFVLSSLRLTDLKCADSLCQMIFNSLNILYFTAADASSYTNHICKFEINEIQSTCIEFADHLISRGIALINDNTVFVVSSVHPSGATVASSSRASIDFVTNRTSWIHSVA